MAGGAEDGMELNEEVVVVGVLIVTGRTEDRNWKLEERRGTVTQRSQSEEHRGHREERNKQIPLLRPAYGACLRSLQLRLGQAGVTVAQCGEKLERVCL
jgi:hypothetical protein